MYPLATELIYNFVALYMLLHNLQKKYLIYHLRVDLLTYTFRCVIVSAWLDLGMDN